MKKIIPALLLLASCTMSDMPKTLMKVENVMLVYELISEDLAIVKHDPETEVKYFVTKLVQDNLCPKVEADLGTCTENSIPVCIAQWQDECLSWSCKYKEVKVECDVSFRKVTREGILDKDSKIYRGSTDYGTFIRVDMKDQYEFYGTKFY